MGLKWDGLAFDRRLAFLTGAKALTLCHILLWVVIEFLLIILMVIPVWVVDSNDYWCGLFRCVYKGDGEGKDFQWVRENCANQYNVDYGFACKASKTGSAFILMAFFHIFFILCWNFVMLVSLPYLKVVPSTLWNTMSVCLDVVASVLVCLTWILFLLLNPIHGGQFQLSAGPFLCVCVWLMTFAPLIFSIARMVIAPSDEGLISFSITKEENTLPSS